MWTQLADFALAAASVLIAVPLLVFSIEVALSLLPPRRQREPAFPTDARAVVLIPAHNEAAGIRRTLRNLQPTLGARHSILVVADNCTDDTAAIVRGEGIAVIERRDPQRRGKGYALSFGIEHLAADPPDVLLVVDADCSVHPDLVRRLVTEVVASGQPAQAHYCFRAPEGSGPLNAVSELALWFRGFIRPRGAARLGGPCSLYGSGMAFPWRAVRDVPQGGDHLVEDMQFGIDLMLAGYRPRFCPEVNVHSELPRCERGILSQRTRWEQGHLQTLFTQAPRLAAAALRQRSPALLWAALDLAVPPLALLAAAWAAMAVLTTALTTVGVGRLAAAVLAGSGALFGLAILAGWLRFCRRQIPLRVLVLAPAYVVRKIPLYWKMLTSPQRRWIRTPRA